MEWADDIGSRPAAWSYVPFQSYSGSLRVFYRTLVVRKDTDENPKYNNYVFMSLIDFFLLSIIPGCQLMLPYSHGQFCHGLMISVAHSRN